MTKPAVRSYDYELHYARWVEGDFDQGGWVSQKPFYFPAISDEQAIKIVKDFLRLKTITAEDMNRLGLFLFKINKQFINLLDK